jgi:hypothetical protein
MSFRSRDHITKSQFDKGVNADYYKKVDDITSFLDKDEDEGTIPGSAIGSVIDRETKKHAQLESIASSSSTRSVAELRVSMWKQVYLS